MTMATGSSIVGVYLAGDLRDDKGDALGVIRLPNRDVLLSEIRAIIQEELQNFSHEFRFLTQDRHPVLKHQEKDIRAQEILGDNAAFFIQKHFDNPRIGIKTSEGDFAGFVFFNLNRPASDLRTEVSKQILRSVGIKKKMNFQFQDKNGWPVHFNQEPHLSGWDLACEGCIRITGLSPFFKPAKTPVISEHNIKTNGKRQLEAADTTDSGLDDSGSHKDVVISYVHSEADQHAKKLKNALSDLGLQVYLDKDDIKAGQDWMDSLNSAVLQCSVFVPLITTRYGNTRYTDKEIKLADTVNKIIIPVNFLNSWPPSHLAIQFASIQYISWKTEDEINADIQRGESVRAEDIRFWDALSIQRVASSIRDEFIANQSKKLQHSEDVVDKLTPEHNQIPVLSTSVPAKILDFKSKKIIVSLHPDDDEKGHQLKILLESKRYSVWCTTEILCISDSQDDLSSVSSTGTTPTTPLPTNMFPSFHTDGTDSFYPLQRHPTLKYSCSIDATDNESSQHSPLVSSYHVKSKEFQRQVSHADLVIIILSKKFVSSKASVQQALYCLQRKKVIALKCTEMELSVCFQKRLQFATVLTYSNKEEMDIKVLHEVEATLKKPPPFSMNPAPLETKLFSKVKELESKLPSDVLVYVTGSARFRDNKSESICHAIGQELAALKFVTLCTCGFYGVEESVSRSFCEERELSGEKPARVYHILPHKDTKSFANKARQNADGTFQQIPYGQVIYTGNSVEERNSIVSRLFHICILVEGGKCSARRAAEFIWNDKTVIPVMSTGHAAAGELEPDEDVDMNALNSAYMVPPLSVDYKDWSALKNSTTSPENVGVAIKRIVTKIRASFREKPTSFPAKLRKVHTSVT